MPALLPLTFSDTAVAVNPVAHAMSPLTQAYLLGGISDQLEATLPREMMQSDHSIPHIGAYVEYMRRQVFTQLPGQQPSSYVNCWRGMMAMVGLSRLYGFELEIEAHDMTAPPAFMNGRVSPLPTYKQEMNRLGLLDSNIFYVIKRVVVDSNGLQKKYDLAMLDPRVILIPFKNIDPAAVAGVPWCRVFGDKLVWYPVDVGFDSAEDEIKARLKTEYRQLSAWLEQQAAVGGGAPNLINHIRNWATELLHDSQPIVLGNTFQLKGEKAGVFMNSAYSSSAFCKVPDLKVPLTPMFAPKLMLTVASQLSTTTAWDNSVVDDNQQRLMVVPPISAEFGALLNQNAANGDLKMLNIRTTDEFVANGRIRVEFIFADGLLTLSRSMWYTTENIVFADNFPYFVMWPYVNLPANAWKSYYVYMVQHHGGALPPSNCSKINAASALAYEPQPGSTLTTLTPKDDDTPISLRTSREFPRVIPLQYRDELASVWPCGCLLVDPPSHAIEIEASSTAQACIDFGTSNSVCVVKVGNGGGDVRVHRVLNGEERVKPLVAFNVDASQDIDISDFHRLHGPSLHKRDYKFPSVGQLYTGMNLDPIVSGQILLAEGGVIDYFANKNSNLQSVGIFTNMKQDRNALANVNRATQVFLEHLALLCALEAKCMGANNIDYFFSYPNVKYHNVLEPLWQTAFNYIQGLGIFAESNLKMGVTERLASADFVRTLPSVDAQASLLPGFAVVDIGGGTSDMTVWRQPTRPDDPIFRNEDGSNKQLVKDYVLAVKNTNSQQPVQGANLSFRYAGNQLFGNTFYSYFKRHISDMPIVFPRIFGLECKDGKAVAPANTTQNFAMAVAMQRRVSAVNNYMATLPTVESMQAPGFAALTTLLNSLLEDPGINATNWCSPACAELNRLLSFKLKGILYVLGLLIGECGGIHPNAKAGVFNIYLVGGGSQAHQYVNSLSFDKNAFTMLSQLPGLLFDIYDPQQLRNRFKIVPPTNGNKVEVVDGMLNRVSQEESDIANTVFAPTLPVNELANIGQNISDKLMDELRSAYKTFVRFTVAEDEKLSALLPRLELVDDDEGRTPAQDKVYAHYMQTYTKIWDDMNSSLDDNVSTVAREAVFSLAMAEEMLDSM